MGPTEHTRVEAHEDFYVFFSYSKLMTGLMPKGIFYIKEHLKNHIKNHEQKIQNTKCKHLKKYIEEGNY